MTAELARRLRAYEAQLDAIELRKASQELRAIWAVGNEYLQAAAPWTAIKTDPERAAAVTRFALNLIRLYAVLSRPFVPDASAAMLAALRLDDADWPEDADAALAALPTGQRFDVPDVLFAKLDDARRAELEARLVGEALEAARGRATPPGLISGPARRLLAPRRDAPQKDEGEDHVSRLDRGHRVRGARPALQRLPDRARAGRAALDRGALVRGAGLVRRRALSGLVGHPQRPDAALGRDRRLGLGVPRAVDELERQHGRPPGPAGHLRAPRRRVTRTEHDGRVTVLADSYGASG